MSILKFKFDKDIKIVPLFDVHVGSPHFNEKAFLETIDYIQKNKRVYWILDGDCCDNITPGKINPYGQTSEPHTQLQKIIKYLEPIKHRGLFMLDGNHLQRTKKQAYMDASELLAQMLDIPYAGIGGYVEVKVGKQKYLLATQHGYYVAKNSELELFRLKEVYPKAHMYLLGHDHQLFARPKVFLSIDENGNEVEEIKYFMRGGNYLNYANYARERLYSLQPSGSLSIHLFKDKHKINVNELMYLGDKCFWKNK